MKVGLMLANMGAAIAISAIASSAQSVPAGNGAPAILFDDVRVFDGEKALGVRDVLISNGKIVRIARTIAHSPGVMVIDGHGKTLLPGLIDAHVHAIPGGAADALRFGVTSEFDLYGWPTQQAARRAKRRSLAQTDEADLWSAGFGVTPPGGHPTEMLADVPAADQPPTLAPGDDPVRFIADRIAEGSDYIKVIEDDGARPGQKAWLPSFGPVRFRQVMRAAVATRLPVIVHAQQIAVSQAAVNYGAAALAHAPCDQPGSRAFYAQMRRQGVRLIPTLAIYQGIAGRTIGVDAAADPQFAPWLSPFQKTTLTLPIAQPQPMQASTAMAAVARAHRAGVIILAGTDAPNPTTAFGVSLHLELALLVAAGLSPAEALTAATAEPARFYRADDRGRISPGLRADLLLVDGNPLADITMTRRIAGIWKNGFPVDRSAPVAAAAGQ